MDTQKLFVFILIFPLFGFSSQSYSLKTSVKANHLRLQAEFDDPVSQHKLANQYNFKIGTLRKPALAKKWYRAAALNGHIESQNHLGLLYLEFKNFIEAKVWFESAASQGHARANSNLASMYETGDGVLINRKKAHSLYLKGAVLGDVQAMYKVSLNLTSGDYIKKDHFNGCVWVYRAENFFNKTDMSTTLAQDILRQKQNCQRLLSKTQIIDAHEAANYGFSNNNIKFKKLMSLTH